MALFQPIVNREVFQPITGQDEGQTEARAGIFIVSVVALAMRHHEFVGWSTERCVFIWREYVWWYWWCCTFCSAYKNSFVNGFSVAGGFETEECYSEKSQPLCWTYFETTMNVEALHEPWKTMFLWRLCLSSCFLHRSIVMLKPICCSKGKL